MWGGGGNNSGFSFLKINKQWKYYSLEISGQIRGASRVDCGALNTKLSIFIRWSDGMGYCRSDWPGLFFFFFFCSCCCCSQAKRVDFGLFFCFIHFPISPPIPGVPPELIVVFLKYPLTPPSTQLERDLQDPTFFKPPQDKAEKADNANDDEGEDNGGDEESSESLEKEDKWNDEE